jgi:hypothetical protein
MNAVFKFAKVTAAFFLLAVAAAMSWHAHVRTQDIPVTEREIAVIALFAAVGFAILWMDRRKV